MSATDPKLAYGLEKYNSMTEHQDIPWKRISVEAATIIASILLAFAIDAWWHERQLRVEEQEILAGLHTEFVANHKVLTRTLSLNQRGMQSLQDFLKLVEGDQYEDTKAIVLATLTDITGPYTTDLGNGTLDALLSSGRLENLTNRRLRALLTAWEGVISDVWDDEAHSSKVVVEIFLPHIVQEHYSFADIERSSEDSPGIRRLLADETFRHLVTIRIDGKDHLSGELEQAIAAAEHIIAELDDSID